MAGTVTVSLEHYLGTNYVPDVEFVHGELKGKPVVPRLHGRVQLHLCLWIL